MHIHPLERDIELFLEAPEELASEERAQIEAHLSSCLQCRDIAALLRSFHAELKQLRGTNPKVEQFLDGLLAQTTIIELRPYRYSPDPAEFGQHILTVLAAKSETGSDYRYSSVCTLMSRDEQILVRILKDQEMENYRIFLITKQGEHSPNATIRFPAFELSISLDPESQQAVFTLPSMQTAVDWSNIVAELRIA